MLGSGNAPSDFRIDRRARASLADPMKEDRLLPNSAEAEQGTIGCILLSPNECIGLCMEKIEDSAAFFDLRHRTIYECLVSMHNDKTPIDLITVQQELKDLCQLESVGGLAYLACLPDATPSAANLAHYIAILLEKFTLRRLISTCTETVSNAFDHQGDVDGLIDDFDRNARKITERTSGQNFVSAKALLPEAIQTIERLHQNQGQIHGIATGLIDLDKMTGGFKPGEMIVIAARPSEGKSSLALNISDHVAVELGLPVGFFSLEMTSASLMMRAICSRARVSATSVRNGSLSERDFKKLTTAAAQLNKSPLFVDETSSMSMTQCRAKAERAHRQYGIKLFVLDFMQAFRGGSKRRADTREQEVADISNGIKAMAKELKVPVIAISALNREVTRRGGKPAMSDIRQSGAVESDADIIGLLYKPDRDDDGQQTDAIPVNLIIAKSRDGQTGEVKLTFLRSLTRFESVSRISPEDVREPYVD